MSTPIPGHDYPRPTRADFEAALERVLGAEDAQRAWGEACQRANLSPTLVDPVAVDLTAVAQCLIQFGGLQSIVGHSMYVRLITYETLAKRHAKTAGGTSHV